MFGVWTNLKSDGLLLTALTETDGSLSVNYGYDCFVRKTNEQKVFMCVCVCYFSFLVFLINQNTDIHPYEMESAFAICSTRL